MPVAKASGTWHDSDREILIRRVAKLVEYEIRPAAADDLALLSEVERRAAALFRDCLDATGLSEALLADVYAIDDLEQARQSGHLWVADNPDRGVVGFALVVDVDGYAHLDELDVLPAYGRCGIGSALLNVVCGWARQAGYPAVTLRTFRTVPWNVPFYERRGFRVVDSALLSAGHVELESSERRRGLRTDLRVTMIYSLVVARGFVPDADDRAGRRRVARGE